MKISSCPLKEVPADEYCHSFSTSPLCSLKELLQYSDKAILSSSSDNYSDTTDKATLTTGTQKEKKLLVCHDMRGNYLSDRFNNGSLYDENAFELTHWCFVDAFCYFSHNFVTIPPYSWVQACRRHRASVIGTVITEWEAGNALCTELFSSSQTVHLAVSALVRLAIEHDLDGWLINIENELPVDCIDNVLLFLTMLRTEMVAHKGKNSQVIWYDAVTVEGKLEWQDTVTPSNKAFFDASDGIFVNYTWKLESLDTCIRNCCNETLSDIYFGIDVFGRGSLGGGGYNCHIALDALSDSACFSSALFAPGWLLESDCVCPDSECGPSEKYHCIKKDFVDKSSKFWGQFKKWIQCDRSTFLRTSDMLGYISTAFSSSSGHHVYASGKPFPHWQTVDDIRDRIDSIAPFYNLGLQDMIWQVVSTAEARTESRSHQIAFDETVGWEGTGSLRFSTTSPRLDEDSCYLPLLEIPLQGSCVNWANRIRIKATEHKSHQNCSLFLQLESFIILNGHDLRISFIFKDTGEESNQKRGHNEYEFVVDQNGCKQLICYCSDIAYSSLTSMGADEGYWEMCTHSLPALDSIIPLLIEEYGPHITSLNLHMLYLQRATVRLESLSSATDISLHLGTFCIVDESSYLLEKEKSPQLPNLKCYNILKCQQSNRIGVSIMWDAFSSDDKVRKKIFFDGYSLFAVTCEQFVVHITKEVVKSNVSAVGAEFGYCLLDALRDMSSSEGASLKNDDVTLVGYTRCNTCHLNLLPRMSFEVSIGGDECKVSCDASRLVAYLIILHPVSFAHDRPSLLDSPAILFFKATD